MGPTPPGTGVIHPARFRAASKGISPMSRPSGVRLIPTSMTIDPGLIHAASMTFGMPIATMMHSAC